MRITPLSVLIVLLSTAAMGAPITTLYNTGVDSTGALLVGGNGTADTHYTVISGPGAPTGADTYFNGAYFADGPLSRWISSTGTGGPSAGSYVFETTFDLTGFDPTLTSISGQCATDNSLSGITLNGGSVSGDCDGFGSFGALFSISSGFVGGVNSLQFTVVDAGSPMAFRAQFTSDTTPLGPSAIPEPSAFVLMGGGLLLIAARLKRKRA